MTTAVARNTVVARECLATDEVEDAEAVGEGPDVGFVEPHERRMDNELCLHCEVECNL